MRAIGNILVTGGAGFIGSAFIRYLFSQSQAYCDLCINYDLLTYAGNLENLSPIADHSRYRFFQGDIANQSLVEHLCQEYEIDTVIHFAAESHVDTSIEQPQLFLETNVLGTFHLLEVVRRNPHIHFHHVSTDEVYGQLGDTGFFNEESPYNPSSPYSASKAAADHLVRAYATTYRLSTTLSNCSNNYGPYQFPEKLIPLMIRNCLEKRPLPIYGQGENIRDWLYVEDHAEALVAILQYGKKGETYTIGGKEEWRNLALVEKIIEQVAERTGTPVLEYQNLLTFVTDRAGHDYRYAIDATKMETELGWIPRHSFDKGIEKTVDWYLENREWLATTRMEAMSYE